MVQPKYRILCKHYTLYFQRLFNEKELCSIDNIFNQDKKLYMVWFQFSFERELYMYIDKTGENIYAL